MYLQRQREVMAMAMSNVQGAAHRMGEAGESPRVKVQGSWLSMLKGPLSAVKPGHGARFFQDYDADRQLAL